MATEKKCLVCVVSPCEGHAEFSQYRFGRRSLSSDNCTGCMQSISAKSNAGLDILACTQSGDNADNVAGLLASYQVEFWVLRHVGFQADGKTWRFEWQTMVPQDAYDFARECGYDMTDYRRNAMSIDDTQSLTEFIVWQCCHAFRDELRERRRAERV